MKYIVSIIVSIIMVGLNVSPVHAKEIHVRHFSAASLNIKIDLTLAEAIEDTKKAIDKKPDVIGFQEIGGDVQADYMRKSLSAAGYGFIRLSGPAKNVPIAFDKGRFDKVKAFPWWLSERTFVRAPGAGPRFLAEKEATVLILKDAKRRTVAVVNLHLAPQPELNNERNTLHTSQMERLLKLQNKLVEDGVHEIVFVGDFNTEEHFRYQDLVEAGLNKAPFINTHEHGALDHVLSTFPNADPRKYEVNSDHDLLVVDLERV